MSTKYFKVNLLLFKFSTFHVSTVTSNFEDSGVHGDAEEIVDDEADGTIASTDVVDLSGPKSLKRVGHYQELLAQNNHLKKLSHHFQGWISQLRLLLYGQGGHHLSGVHPQGHHMHLNFSVF